MPPLWTHLVAGGLACCVSRTIFSPLTVICQSQSFERGRGVAGVGFFAVASRVAEKRGIVGFWRGNLVQCLHGFPEKGLTLAFYEAIRRSMDEDERCVIPDSARGFVAGALAGASAAVLLFPLETVSARLAVGCGREGLGRGLYNGIGATVISIAPSMGITLGTYHSLKHRMGDEPHPAAIAAAAAAAAMLGSVATWPVYGIRQRVQFIQGAAPTVFQTASNIIRKEGVGGLYVGCSANLIKISLKSSIQLSAYEQFLGMLSKRAASE
nr:mitochondrial substrate carrier family protein [Oceanusvirus sp.]